MFLLATSAGDPRIAGTGALRQAVGIREAASQTMPRDAAGPGRHRRGHSPTSIGSGTTATRAAGFVEQKHCTTPALWRVTGSARSARGGCGVPSGPARRAGRARGPRSLRSVVLDDSLGRGDEHGPPASPAPARPQEPIQIHADDQIAARGPGHRPRVVEPAIEGVKPRARAQGMKHDLVARGPRRPRARPSRATKVPLPSVALGGVELRIDAQGYRPWKRGVRFSKKARVPSL